MEGPADNPYATPVAEPAAEDGVPNGYINFGAILRKWERLRIYYNVLLAGLVLFITFGVYVRHVSNPRFWISICFGGVIANICFLLGPTIEAYGTHFRVWQTWFTNSLFVAGLGFTALLALISIVTFR